jgi:BirA family transcriptional regulator, biotin operon repressor / biotin---[acetyl-CoA-carboxylase] ligase
MMHSLGSLRIRSALDELESWGHFAHVQWFEEIDSTNRFLRDETKMGNCPIPSLVGASRQSAGAGRGSNRWYSPEGCLMFSFSRKHNMEHALLPLWVGLCVAKAIEGLTRTRPQIKWPNDVYLDGKKACGILIEGVTRPRAEASELVAVVGIGINCTVDLANAPVDVQANATSLHLHSREASIEACSPESILVRVVKTLIEKDDEPRHGDLLDEWSRYSLLDGRHVVVDVAGENVAGVCHGVANDGSLILVDSRGKHQQILAGSVLSFDPVGK